MRVVYFALVGLFPSLIAAQTVSADVQALVATREEAVTNIADAAKAAYSLRCSPSTRSCATCTPDACTAYGKDQYACKTDFGTPADLCTADTGRLMDPTRSTVRIPSSVDKSSNTVKEDVCYGVDVNDAFTENSASSPSLRWQYFATATGVHRTFPARAWPVSGSSCARYDPRERPWFVAAASGPKNVVLVLDKSGSMNQGSRWSRAVEAAKAVIGALTSSDYFGVILFSSVGATDKWRVLQQQGTAANKESATSWLDSRGAGGSTYFSEGLTAAKDMLDSSKAAEAYTTCQTTVLFLTDGFASETSASSPSLNDVHTAVDNLVKDHNVNLFSFSLGSGADAALPLDIACRGNGLWSAISDNGDLRTEMLGYYRFLAAARATESVVWTEPFVDASGLGEIVTAARAVFDQPASGNGLALLVGVAGVDIKTSDVTAAGIAKDEFLRHIADKSAACTPFAPTQCELQRLRELHSASSVCSTNTTCAPVNAEERVTCGQAVTASSATCAAEPLTSSNAAPHTCCEYGLSDTLVGVIVGVIAAVVIVVGVVFVCRRRRNANSSVAKPPSSSHTIHSRSAQPTASGPMARPARAYAPAPAHVAAPPPANPTPGLPTYPPSDAARSYAYPAAGPGSAGNPSAPAPPGTTSTSTPAYHL